MERLTDRRNNQNDRRLSCMNHCYNAGDCINCDSFENAVDRLATYEDAEERGELVRLRWIPVTERLPENSGDYLVFDACENLYVNEWHFLLRMWQYDDSRITHWMPLPCPPEEENP